MLEKLQNHFGEGPVPPQDVRDLLRKLKVTESSIDCALQAFETAGPHGLTCKGLVSWIFDSPGKTLQNTGEILMAPTEPGPDFGSEPAKARALKIRAQLDMTADRFEGYMRLLARFARCCEIPRTELRGITLGQLRVVEDFVTQHAEEWEWFDVRSKQHVDPATANLYHVSTWLIMPATNTEDCAWVELVARGDQRPQWFCSHWWGEPVRDFIRCVSQHQELRCFNASVRADAEKSAWAYWVCAYANRQHSLEAELSSDPKASSFFKALQLVEGMLIILDTNATPFTRLWCAFEAYTALSDRRNGHQHLLLDIATKIPGTEVAALLTDGLTVAEQQLESALEQHEGPSKGPPKEGGVGANLAKRLQLYRQRAFTLEVLSRGLQPKLHEAQASKEEDRRRILNSIVQKSDLDSEPDSQHVKYETVNTCLGGIFARAGLEQALLKGQVQELSFHEALRADKSCSELKLDLTHMLPSDVHLADLGLCFPQSLRRLQMDFSGCEKLTATGFAALAAGFPASMQHLQVDFRSCTKLSDEDLAVLGSRWPSELQDLELNFLYCRKIGDSGVAALGEGLPPALRQLKLDLTSTGLGDAGAARLAACLPSELRYLDLEFRYCNIGDGGLAGIAAGLKKLRQLEHFQISMRNCLNLGDAGLVSLSVALPNSLLFLRLNFANLSCNLSDAGLAALAHRLPENVTELCIHCNGASRISSAGLAALAAGLPRRSLKRLQLDFGFCLELEDSGLAALGSALSMLALEELRLDFAVAKFSDAGLAAFGAGLPPALQRLSMNMEFCRKMSMAEEDEMFSDPSLFRVWAAKWHEVNVAVPPASAFGGEWPVAAEPAIAAEAACEPRLRLDSVEGDGETASETLDRSLQLVEPRVPLPAVPCLCLALRCCQRVLRELKLGWKSEAIEDSHLDMLSSALPSTLQGLELKFKACHYIGDEGLAVLGARLPGELQYVLLHFTQCKRVGDVGVRRLVSALPHSLRHLELSLYSCESLTDDGLAGLAVGLSSLTMLQELVLSWSFSETITDDGLAALAAVLSPSLLRLDLDMQKCGIGDTGLSTLALRLPRGLQQLRLGCFPLPKLGDAGVQALAEDLPPELRELSLDFSDCPQIGDAGLIALGANLPAKLEALDLRLFNNTKIGLPGFVGLAKGLSDLAMLSGLRLVLRFCANLCDAGLAEIGKSLPKRLRILDLDMTVCEKVGDAGLQGLSKGLQGLCALYCLQLQLGHCQIGDPGLAALGRNLPEGLQELQLSCSCCERVTLEESRLVLTDAAEFRAWAMEHSQEGCAE